MKMKSVTLLVIAGACGLVAMLGVQQMLSGSKNAEAGEETVQMLVATVEIPAGIPLDATNVSFKRTPKSAAPEGIVTTEEEYKDRALKFPAVPGEPIMLAKLGAPGVIGPSIEIPKGMRVVTVPCNSQFSHSGMLRPGDRVDILLTYKNDGGGGESRTVTVLEYIKVFATDSIRDSQAVTAQDTLAKNVSFLVDPKQAALLMLAESKGVLSLSLRSKVDDAPVEVGTVTDSQLDGSAELGIGDEAAKALLLEEPRDVRKFVAEQTAKAEPASTETPATVAPTWKVEVFSGGKREVQEVALPVEAVAPARNGGVGGWLKSWLQGT